MAKVSVVLTSYNHEKFIGQAIESVINQTFTDWELIIVDDVSPDGSWAVIETYKDPRILRIQNDRTRRYIYNINRAIESQSTGEYIAIHHSDDAWELDKLEKQVAVLEENPSIGAVFSHVQCIDESNQPLVVEWFNQPNKPRTAWLRSLFFNENQLCHPSALVRRSVYEQAGLYRSAHAQTDDAEMWTRLLKITDIHVVQERLTLHRIFSDQSNESGERPDRRARMWLEWYLQKKHYVGMPLNDILEAFPESEKWVTPKGANSGYLLAMFAIEIGGCPGTRLFGVELLYQLMNSAEERAEIEAIHGFTYLDFIALTGQEEFFNPKALAPVAPKAVTGNLLRNFAGKVVRRLRSW
ncbi:glycosyltransferase family 2 protein [Pseudomonas atacamensis]|uniref:glycosyltransferase n=1 Tax=Pseudomonas TaxID=286 RepID=UPI001A9EF934|nr:glycosyltransferase family 2 protein [Pseudomonas atacamensis]MDH1256819.1 glycosyltransferase [Pseudomonas atacamensis]MEB2856616.1 glycosyltransferase family 2 protein [Pseudomonas atacamensis]